MTERYRDTKRHRDRDIKVIMWAPFLDLPSESWSSRKASGVSSSLSPKGLRTKRINDVNFSRGQETNIAAQHSSTETKFFFPLPFLFYSSPKD